MLHGAFFHEGHDDDFDIHFPDHHGDDDGAADANGDLSDELWRYDNVELVTVGVDVGSSTSHLLFARLHLQRLAQSLSSRFAVVKREVLHRSPVLLTPYRSDGLIDVEDLEQFVLRSYEEAGLSHDTVDTGAVILTGAALERANARAVADLFAGAGGKFVCASAGHNLEGILAAQGSGAAALSHARGETLLHVDIGGGTSKLALLRDGEVLHTSAVHVGGRLIAFDEQGRVVRIEPSATLVAEALGIRLELGEPLSEEDRQRIVARLLDILLDAINGRPPADDLARAFDLTERLTWSDEDRPAGVTFSGGVAEYIYGRESRAFGDIAPDLAESLMAAQQRGELPAPAITLAEGIRATVLGASQFSVQLSGNTVHITDPTVLPLRNLPVVYARLPARDLDEAAVERAIRDGFRRMDLEEGAAPVAIALPWKGEPYYAAVRALAGGIAGALPGSIRAGFPLVLALDGDVGRTLGGILAEEFGVTADLVSVDGLQLLELDYVDLGAIVEPAHVVPVVVKSLAFPAPAAGSGERVQPVRTDAVAATGRAH